MTLVIAHRGASAYELENTLAAFRLAVEMGAHGVELDVHGTADSEFVVHHDEEIRGMRIANVTLAELRREPLRNGEKVPTLTEALGDLGTAVSVHVEVKALPPALDEHLFDCLDKGPTPDTYHVHSFDHRIIRRLTNRRPDFSYGVLSVSVPVQPELQWLDSGANTLWQQQQYIDGDLLTVAHEQGCKVFAWTVDDPSRMMELVSLGVDAICTNKPDVARKTLD